MQVDQQRFAENGQILFNQAFQRRVIGQVNVGQTFLFDRERQLFTVNQFVRVQLARDDAESVFDARRIGLRLAGDRIGKHGRIQFQRVAVQIDPHPPVNRGQQRDSHGRRERKQPIDGGIFVLLEIRQFQIRQMEQPFGIKRSAVRRRQNDGNGRFSGLFQQKRRIVFQRRQFFFTCRVFFCCIHQKKSIKA